MKPKFLLVTALTLTGAAPIVGAADWTHIMGPNIDRKSTEPAPKPWTGAPKKLWEVPANSGFSSFVTGGGRAYTVVEVADRETVVALDRKTGRTLWQTKLGPTGYRNGGNRGASGNDGGDGPRATPVFANNLVFVFGGKFDLHALDSATGKIVWQHDLIKDFGGSEIVWSNSASPLVLGDRVLVSGGGAKQSFIAFNAKTGAVLWKTGNDQATHATPVIATIHGQQQALFRVERGLVALDPNNGRELWHYPFPHKTATAPSPIVWNDIVTCTSGYGVGGGACQVTLKDGKWDVTEIWRSPGNRNTAAHWSTSVAHEGYLYGCYGHGSYGSGPFKCIDIKTGKVMWEQPGYGHGQVIMAGNRLIATTDAGVLTMIDPSPQEYRELARADVIEGKVWSSPALSDGQILLRSTTHGVCLEL